MDTWTGVQSIACLSFWTLFHLSCCNFTKYHIDEANSDKLCLVDSATVGVLVVNLLACLATCSRITECRAAIYHKGSRTCYRLPDWYQYQTCTMNLVGAMLYRKGCRSGWTPGNRSCYRFTGQFYSNHSESEAICKGFNGHAHLADIKTEEEFQFIRNWLYLEGKFSKQGFWTGATYNNRWTWSDGTEVDYWPEPHHIYVLGCTFIYLPLYGSANHHCFNRAATIQGLCELDIF